MASESPVRRDSRGSTGTDGSVEADECSVLVADGGATETGAAYVFRVAFSLAVRGVRASPRRFETVVEYPAPPPGESGWRFFRDYLWRGEVGDAAAACDLATEWLGVPVKSASFRELRTTDAYLDALREAIAADLDAFNAADPDDALTKYLGSSIHVRDP